MMLIRSPWQFYGVRFLLGVAEAGFFPGIVFYLAHWFPKAVRGRALSAIYMLGALSGVAMGALSPWLLSLDGAYGLRGWQWLFLVEGLPAAVIGVLVLILLPERPERVRWLNGAQKAWIGEALANDAEAHGPPSSRGVLAALTHPLVWRLGLYGFLTIGAGNTFNLSAPLMLHEATGLDTFSIGRLVMLAGGLGAAGICLAGVLSDSRGERFTTMLVSTAVCGACCGIMAVTLHGYPAVFLAAYFTWAFAIWAVSFGYLMCWPDLLPRHLLAVACAAINSIAQVGSFLLPYGWGALRDASGGFTFGLIVLGICFALATLVALMSRMQAGRPRLEPRPA
jgi:ACS family tartrate transporter-like MFS transporter